MPNSDSENFSDSEFDEGSDFQSSRGGGSEAKPTPSKEGRSQLKNLPFDEALDLSASDASVSRQGSEPRGSPGRAASSQSMSKTPGSERRRGGGGGGGGGDAKGETMVVNQQHDEAHSLGSDGDSLVSEESVMTNEDSEIAPQKNSAADRPAAKLAVESAARQRAGGAAAALGPSAALSAQPKPAALNARSGTGVGSAGGGGGGSSSQGNTSSKGGNAAASESESDDSDADEESRSGVPVAGAYNAADYKHLPVNAEIKDLFQYITRYKPHEVELDSTLKCFIPDFIPAVGEMDAFIKVPPPDASRDELGLKVLDEPAAQQSDATVLELQLRAGSKKAHGDLSIRSIENAAKNPQEIEKWIRSIQDLHKQKHSVEVQYKRNMPDLDSLMQEWPAEFEESLQQLELPSPQLDMSIEEYARVMCAVLDVPVYDNLIESLHVIFSLYMAFKENPHFQARMKEGGAAEGYTGGNEGKGADIMDFQGADVMTFGDEGKV